MATKRKVKIPGRFVEDERWYIIQFTDDEEYSYPVPSGNLEDEETGENGNEKQFKVGDSCRAPWLNGKDYRGKVVFENGSKEECLKFRAKVTSKNSEKPKNDATTTYKNGSTKRKSGATAKKSTVKPELAKKKKDSAENKKIIENNRKDVTIKAAEELFRNNFLSPTQRPSMHTSLSQSPIFQSCSTQPTTPQVSTVQSPIPQPYTFKAHTPSNQPASVIQSSAPQSFTTPKLQSTPTQSASFLKSPHPQDYSLVVQSPSTQSVPSVVQSPQHYPLESASTKSVPSVVQPPHPKQYPLEVQSPSTKSVPSVAQSPHPQQYPMEVQSPLNQSAPCTPKASVSQTPSTYCSQNPSAHHFELNCSMPLYSTPKSTTTSLPSVEQSPHSQHYQLEVQSPSIKSVPSVVQPPHPQQYPLEVQSPSTKSVPSVAQSPHPQQYPLEVQSPSTKSVPSVAQSPHPQQYPMEVQSPFNQSAPCTPKASVSQSPSTYCSQNPSSNQFELNCSMPLHSTPKSTKRSFLAELRSQLTPVHHGSPADKIVPCPEGNISATLGAIARSQTGCGDCVLKEKDIQALREHTSQLETEINYWKSEATRLQNELDRSSPSQSSSSDHYYPRRGMRIDKCNYVVVDENCSQVPNGYIPLVPGHQVFVPNTWLNHVQATFYKKTKTWCLKNMMSGIYEPEELVKMTATALFETKMGKAIRGYATTKIGLDARSVVEAVNSKIGTMTRAVKTNRVRR